MSEVIVAKAGGTSNATSEAVLHSLAWAEQSDIFVVSAPGRVKEIGGDKVTQLLLGGRKQYLEHGAVDAQTTDEITARYDEITRGIGSASVHGAWLDKISSRIQDAASHSEHAASMLGEQLQAELYQSLGFTLLDPSTAQHDLGNDPDAWRSWLSSEFIKGKKYVLPGNITKVDNEPVTFGPGGSDTSGGLAAYGIHADLNLNLTDGPAMSADPKLIDKKKLQPITHLLYVEGRELGRNGTELVHPAALVPLMIGNIPTHVHSTRDPDLPPTVYDNDYGRAAQRAGKVVGLSLMKNVSIHSVYEPGMAEAIGRLAEFDTKLAAFGVPIVDSQGDGVDGQRYFTSNEYAEAAHQALQDVVRHGEVKTKANVNLITMVGYQLSNRLVDNIYGLISKSGITVKQWQHQGHDLSHGRHSLRLSVDKEDSKGVFNRLHAHYLERSGRHPK